MSHLWGTPEGELRALTKNKFLKTTGDPEVTEDENLEYLLDLCSNHIQGTTWILQGAEEVVKILMQNELLLKRRILDTESISRIEIRSDSGRMYSFSTRLPTTEGAVRRLTGRVGSEASQEVNLLQEIWNIPEPAFLTNNFTHQTVWGNESKKIPDYADLVIGDFLTHYQNAMRNWSGYEHTLEKHMKLLAKGQTLNRAVYRALHPKGYVGDFESTWIPASFGGVPHRLVIMHKSCKVAEAEVGRGQRPTSC